MDLATQIREYSRDVDAAQAPLTVDEIRSLRRGEGAVRPITPAFDPASSSRIRNWKGWAVAAAVFVAVVLAGVLVGLLRSDSTIPVVDTPPSTVAPPATTAPPTTVVEDTEAIPTTTVAETTEPDLGSGPELEWELVDGITWLDDAQLDLYDSGAGYVVVQRSFDGSTTVISASADGLTWTEETYQLTDVDGFEFDLVSGDVTVTPERFIAVGGTTDSEPLRVVVIDRTTGNVASHEFPGSGGRVIVTPDDSLLVAPGDGRSWHSADGETWTEVTIESDVVVLRPIALLDGALVTLRDFEGTGDRWVLYRSTNGLDWAPEACCEYEGDYDIWAVFAPWEGGILTVTMPQNAGDERRFVHLTEQGARELTPPLSVLDVSDDPDDPFFYPPTAVAAGEMGILALNWQGKYVFSADGQEWSIADLPDEWRIEESSIIGGFGIVGSDAVLVRIFTETGWRLIRGTIAP